MDSDNKRNNSLSPEGFKELVEYFSHQKSGYAAKASEIQTYLQDTYKFTSGKVTGIIKRANERKIIVKTGRGEYKLSLNDGEIESMVANDVINRVSDEIKNAIKKIETIVAQEIRSIEPNDIVRIQKVIKLLDQINV
ncbi:hypothetical protein [Anaerocolumna xylanovorans]|uniref:Uncharacterized protein n=1 Tax=Anaerocolumna xylanovorans DSM 12503 TaxID=1121345 RepID=A0A1M7YNA0_9FIRM|nr:hypothetical protein [Anaerocolumna xylanovorans]SHO54079.1 hypothetical protein SAMN02745217_04518 [Anaerocolumna xylanovorans DSM 12503]